jgi:poly-gamma-glutamate synthesis protein (capsule biosynthesis protein)
MKRFSVVLLTAILLAAGLFFAWEPLGLGDIASDLGGRLIGGGEFADKQEPKGTDSESPGQEDLSPIYLSIACVGDIMVHKSQIASQYDGKTRTYNYDNNFQYVKKYIEAADLALCNVETTFSGGEPSGYPSFNAPDALASSLARAGFDVGLTSNNHMHDKGLAGMKRTLRVLRSAGLATAGSRLPWEKNYVIMDVKGVKVGIISYTYETPSNGGRPTINGVIISDKVKSLINSFNYEVLDDELEKVNSTIEAAREDGAEVIVVYYHWGEEYQQSPNMWQEYIAQKTADMDVDVIFASHPHVLQSIDILKSEKTGEQVPVFYSMGNFLSNQRAETLSNRYTEQGMIARVNIKYDRATGKAALVRADAMKTWLDKYRSGGKDVYAIVPLDESVEGNEALKASGHLHRALQASDDAEAAIGRDYVWK